MDKFGIFKLLNSFFNLNGDNTANITNESETTSTKNDFNLSNFLNAFNTANTASDNTQPATDTKQTAVNHKERILPPLQSSMLKTMTSHDEFVKRVKDKNSTQK